MWLITGPFDSVEQGDTTTTKTKLLKPGKNYGLGRKEQPLVVNSKKISRDACEFKVGPYTPDNMVDPSYVPALEIVNNKGKSLMIKRQRGDDVVCNPSASTTLEDGDHITVVVGIVLVVRWQRIACFVPPIRGMPLFSSEDCASIGISTHASAHELLTHHITPKYEVTTPAMTSLLCAAQLTKPEWLQELVQLGSTPTENDSFGLTALEKSFVPPLESKYRPAFGPALPPALKSFKHWEPNEERLNLLRSFRFILPAEDGEVDAELRDLVVRGGAEYEGFNLKAGLAKWRQVIAKGKRKVEELRGAGKGLVVLAKDSVIQRAVEDEKWKEMVADAESLSAHVVRLETVLEAVVHVDASRIASSGSSSQESPSDSSPLPSFVPNTHPDEPSFPEGSDKKIFTDKSQRAVSPGSGRQDSVMRSPSPPAVPEPPPTQPKRKPLVRRLPLILPVETNEGSVMNFGKLESDVDKAIPESTQAPKPPSGSRPRLKRRLGLPGMPGAPPPEIEMPVVTIDVDDAVEEEPPHKKFKALFEASDPDKMVVEGSQTFEAAYDNAVGTQNESVTQTGQTPGFAPPKRLPVVAEEEESLSGPSQRARSVAFEVPLPVEEDTGPSSQIPATQTRARSKAPPSRQPSEQPRATAKSKKATDSGKHKVDKDEAFLTAVASTKRGKKTEDEFDREFNKLRISKPDLQREEQVQMWTDMGDFDLPNIRGNFMVVMDLDVFRNSNSRREAVTNDTRDAAFGNRPNFKKFKKKIDGFSRAPIELVVEEENDYGMGAGYWKDTTTAKDYTKDSQVTDNGTQRSKGKRRALAIDSDEEGTQSQTLESVKQPVRKPARTKDTKKLFLNSDDDDAKDDAGLESSNEQPPVPSTPAARARASKRRRVVADDDSDDGVTFKGFGKKRRTK
ncbi:hypothetical protein DEU56DRAFT_760630 [Suillus clintonianus]|uniref:uncharacterized protein n=1 Tax=Suillus clintonianus TaxID=1904413 RepID=UPI001B86491F|nr:uncharacterized protein DEU56DRAFT_760630 [Suillus clintonianus]KAG2121622.1 hypothetical protein DEU56DRAFT_760630 [Suillus clintonianus]